MSLLSSRGYKFGAFLCFLITALFAFSFVSPSPALAVLVPDVDSNPHLADNSNNNNNQNNNQNSDSDSDSNRDSDEDKDDDEKTDEEKEKEEEEKKKEEEEKKKNDSATKISIDENEAQFSFYKVASKSSLYLDNIRLRTLSEEKADGGFFGGLSEMVKGVVDALFGKGEPTGEEGESVQADPGSIPHNISDVSWNNAGGMVGYVDSKFGTPQYSIASPSSLSTVTYAYQSLPNVGQRGFIGYAMYGRALSQMGLDEPSGVADGITQMGRLCGVLLYIPYVFCSLADIALAACVKLLTILNPFEWFANAIGTTLTAEHANGVGTGVEGSFSAFRAAIDPIVDFVSSIYTALTKLSWGVIIPIWLAIVIFVLLISKSGITRGQGAGSVIRDFIIRVCFLGLAIPVLGGCYTGILNQLTDHLSSSGGFIANKVLAMTLFDFRSWVENGGGNAGLSSDVSGASYMQLPESISIHVDSEGNLAHEGTDSSQAFSVNAAGSLYRETQGLSPIGALMNGCDTITRFLTFQKYSSADFETAWKGVNASNVEDKSTQADDVAPSQDELRLYGLSAASSNDEFYSKDVFVSGSDLSAVGEGESGLTDFLRVNSPGQGTNTADTYGGDNNLEFSFSNADGGTGASGGLSALSVYNYLASTFTDTGIVIDSPNAPVESARTSHYAVNLVGSNPVNKGLNLIATMMLMVSLATVGWGFAISMLVSVIKNGARMIVAMPPALMGSFRFIQVVISYVAMIICEIVITIILYVLLANMIIAINQVLSSDWIGGLFDALGSTVSEVYSGLAGGAAQPLPSTIIYGATGVHAAVVSGDLYTLPSDMLGQGYSNPLAEMVGCGVAIFIDGYFTKSAIKWRESILGMFTDGIGKSVNDLFNRARYGASMADGMKAQGSLRSPVNYQTSAAGGAVSSVPQGALGGAAAGAGTGALVGSVVPGLGTAVGAGAGALIGAGVGGGSAIGAIGEEEAKRDALADPYGYTSDPALRAASTGTSGGAIEEPARANLASLPAGAGLGAASLVALANSRGKGDEDGDALPASSGGSGDVMGALPASSRTSANERAGLSAGGESALGRSAPKSQGEVLAASTGSLADAAAGGADASGAGVSGPDGLAGVKPASSLLNDDGTSAAANASGDGAGADGETEGSLAGEGSQGGIGEAAGLSADGDAGSAGSVTDAMEAASDPSASAEDSGSATTGDPSLTALSEGAGAEGVAIGDEGGSSDDARGVEVMSAPDEDGSGELTAGVAAGLDGEDGGAGEVDGAIKGLQPSADGEMEGSAEAVISGSGAPGSVEGGSGGVEGSGGGSGTGGSGGGEGTGAGGGGVSSGGGMASGGDGVRSVHAQESAAAASGGAQAAQVPPAGSSSSSSSTSGTRGVKGQDGASSGAGEASGAVLGARGAVESGGSPASSATVVSRGSGAASGHTVVSAPVSQVVSGAPWSSETSGSVSVGIRGGGRQSTVIFQAGSGRIEGRGGGGSWSRTIYGGNSFTSAPGASAPKGLTSAPGRPNTGSQLPPRGRIQTPAPTGALKGLGMPNADDLPDAASGEFDGGTGGDSDVVSV